MEDCGSHGYNKHKSVSVTLLGRGKCNLNFEHTYFWGDRAFSNSNSQVSITNSPCCFKCVRLLPVSEGAINFVTPFVTLSVSYSVVRAQLAGFRFMEPVLCIQNIYHLLCTLWVLEQWRHWFYIFWRPLLGPFPCWKRLLKGKGPNRALLYTIAKYWWHLYC